MKKKHAKKTPSAGGGKTAAPVSPARISVKGAVPVSGAAPLFDRVVGILDAARGGVVRAVNSHMVLAYWLIGREIVMALQGGDDRAEYGSRVLQDLSRRLTVRYGDGYALSSIKDFRLFYSVFSDRSETILRQLESPGYGTVVLGKSRPARASMRSGKKSHAVRGELVGSGKSHAARGELTVGPVFHPSLSWTHYRALMRVENPAARQFYESECVAAGWNTRELERQIHSLYYERLLLSKDRGCMVGEQRGASPKFDPAAILKSCTVLEFLGLPDSPSLHESKLEQAIMENLQNFLLELGRGFSFVARPKCLQFEDDSFYVDLVFYNFILKCFVLIDLKIGKLTHQDVGQMDSYVRLYEELHKVEGDNPTIGLILCSQKNETIARYSVLQDSQQLFATKYRVHLPSEAELAAELKRGLAAIEEGRDR